ncbi:alkaline phosphatase family protein [Alicyclobacillus ferrooxydans]|uniref:alkaline phosphatase family protein n=1 Tax=Alicyclobacillus ferrooxydans TaxID=471514 RepID=UPI0006D547A9|nr:alkaline phosphatase family protein [Alicyclobacillus ferrooxydans]
MNKFVAGLMMAGFTIGLLAGCGQAPQNGNQTGGAGANNESNNLASEPSTTQNNSSQKVSSLVSKLGFSAPLHTVVVIEENHSYAEITGNPHAPYINSLMQSGANMTNAHGVEHPSQPNYLDLFSGSNQGITSDACPNTLSEPNLATELTAAHLTFTGYSESLPKVGYTGCSNASFLSRGTYARKHSPWVNFTNITASENVPWSDFPGNFNDLPTVSFVIPKSCAQLRICTICPTWGTVRM